MAYAMGQPIPLRIEITDPLGEYDDATTVVLYVTLPDGTTVTPTVNHTAVGFYAVDYVGTQAGRHSYRWLATGTNASAPAPDMFEVYAATEAPLVSLAEARKWCRLSSYEDDPEIQRIALAATDICEKYTGRWRRETVTLKFDGGQRWLVIPGRIISVTSITENGVTIASSGYVVDSDLGMIAKGSVSAPTEWLPGADNISVTLVIGSTDTPEPIRQGILILIRHLWDTQRGGSLPRASGGPDGSPDTRFFYSIPNAVQEWWAPYMRQQIR